MKNDKILITLLIFVFLLLLGGFGMLIGGITWTINSHVQQQKLLHEWTLVVCGSVTVALGFFLLLVFVLCFIIKCIFGSREKAINYKKKQKYSRRQPMKKSK